MHPSLQTPNNERKACIKKHLKIVFNSFFENALNVTMNTKLMRHLNTTVTDTSSKVWVAFA